MMLRTTLRTALRTPVTRYTTSRTFITTQPRSKSIIDSAKETLDSLNKKVGQAAASGIDKAENVTETVKENTKDAIHNETDTAKDLKTDAANTSYNDVKQGVKKTAKDVKQAWDKNGTEGVEDKAREALGDDAVDGVKETAKDLKKDAKDAKKEGEEKLDKATSQAGGLKRDAEKKFAQKAQETADKYKGV